MQRRFQEQARQQPKPHLDADVRSRHPFTAQPRALRERRTPAVEADNSAPYERDRKKEYHRTTAVRIALSLAASLPSRERLDVKKNTKTKS
jgi:hypothetical protein